MTVLNFQNESRTQPGSVHFVVVLLSGAVVLFSGTAVLLSGDVVMLSSTAVLLSGNVILLSGIVVLQSVDCPTEPFCSPGSIALSALHGQNLQRPLTIHEHKQAGQQTLPP